MHCLQSLHSPDSTLFGFLPLLFLLVWHPVLYLITLPLDFPVLLLNPGAILTPFTPLAACTPFTSYIPLTSLHSRSFPSYFGALYSLQSLHFMNFPVLSLFSLLLWHSISTLTLSFPPFTLLPLLSLLLRPPMRPSLRLLPVFSLSLHCLDSLSSHYSLHSLDSLPSCCSLDSFDFLYHPYSFTPSTRCTPFTFFNLCIPYILFIPLHCRRIL